MEKSYVFSGELRNENDSGHLCEAEACIPVYLASEVDARIAELAAKWETEIAVAYNEHAHGQRAAFEQAAAELRSLMVSVTK
jgi:hypothetical protein